LGRSEAQFTGELRLGQEAPVNLPESTPHKVDVCLVPVVDIASGHNHVLALDVDGEVHVWGSGESLTACATSQCLVNQTNSRTRTYPYRC
jgi:alpha-tubulin suppressor-like RCC1 family protein